MLTNRTNKQREPVVLNRQGTQQHTCESPTITRSGMWVKKKLTMRQRHNEEKRCLPTQTTRSMFPFIHLRRSPPFPEHKSSTVIGPCLLSCLSSLSVSPAEVNRNRCSALSLKKRLTNHCSAVAVNKNQVLKLLKPDYKDAQWLTCFCFSTAVNCAVLTPNTKGIWTDPSLFSCSSKLKLYLTT